MSSNNIPIAPIILSPNVSSGTTTKSGGTIIQRRQRNSQVNSNTSTVTNNNNTIRTSAVSGSSSLTSSYNHPHHQQQQQQQQQHSSYYYGNNGRGMGDDPSPLQHPQQPPSPHVALHIETNTHHQYQYPNNNSEGVMDLLSSATHNHHYYHHHQYDADNNNYDPEQPQYPVSRSSSSFSAVNQVTEEQIRRFNDNHTYGQSSPYHTTTSSPPTTSIPTATSFKTNAARNIPIWKRKMVLEEDFYRIEDYHTIFRNPHHMTDAQYTKYVNQNNIDNNNHDSTANTSMMNKTCCAYTCSVFSAIAVLFLLWIAILLDTQPLYIPGALPTITVQSVTQQQEQQQQLEQPLYTASSTTNQKNNYQQKQKGQNRQQQQQQQSQPRRTAPRIQFIIPGKNDERLLIAKTAYQAATMYFITMIISRYIYNPIPFHTFYNTYILSLFQACYRRITGQSPQQRHRHSYTDIPDSYDMIGHYASNASSLEGFILAGGGNNTHGSGNGISLLPYATTTTQRSVWFSTAATNSLWTRTTHTMKRYLASKGWYQPSRRRRRHYEIKKTG